MIYKINKIKSKKDSANQNNLESYYNDNPKEIESKADEVYDNIKKELKNYNIELDLDNYINLYEDEILVNCYFYAPKHLNLEKLKEIFKNISNKYRCDYDQLELANKYDKNTDLYLVDLYFYGFKKFH